MRDSDQPVLLITRKRFKMQNRPSFLRTHRSRATVNKRQTQSGDAHRALQPVPGLRKDKERINNIEELHDETQNAPMEKDMQESHCGNAAKEPSGLC